MRNNTRLIALGAALVIMLIAMIIILNMGPTPLEERKVQFDAEPILLLESEVRIAADETLHVTEQIKAKSAGINFKRGIARNLPGSFTNSAGNQQNISYQFISIMRNQEPIIIPDPVTDSKGVTYFLGEADKLLTPGVYDYLLQYTATGYIETLEKTKRLTFNVFGAPALSINSARVVMRFPEALQQENFTFQGEIIAPSNPGEEPVRDTKSVQASFQYDDGSLDPSSAGKPMVIFRTTKRIEPFHLFKATVNWARSDVVPSE